MKMNKYFITLTLAILVVVTQPAHAESPFTLHEGWNLVSADVMFSLNLESLINNGGGIFILNPKDKKYYGGSGNFQTANNSIEAAQSFMPHGDNIVALGMWIYTPKKMTTLPNFVIQDDRFEYYKGAYDLFKGWNFVAITSLMKGKAIGDVSGTCKITSAYIYEADAWRNQADSLKEKFTEDSLGHAMAVKVENDCLFNFDKASQKSSIPALPN
jgi:hypothetical protein